MTPVYIGLGSNMGNRVDHLHQALTRLDTLFELNRLSPVYETLPKYVEDQSPFLNMVVSGETLLDPLQLLAQLKTFEVEIGRVPSSERYGPRAIDLDILFFGEAVFVKPELSIPHPLMAEREFVLRPLADIAAGLRHPVSGQTVVQMLAALECEPEASLFVIDV